MVWGRWVTPLVCGLILSCVQITQQNTRHKRQITPELPKIITQDGHLVFKTGTNHNITFQSMTGGYINVDGDNLKILAQTIKDNKEAIDQLKTVPTSIPSNIEGRLTNIEGRLDNLQPTGQVQSQLTSLENRINNLQNSIPSNVESRLSQIEQSLRNLQPTGQVQTLLSNLTSRLGALDSRVTVIEGTSGTDDNLLQRVSVINRRVQRFQRGQQRNRRVSRLARRVRTLETSVQRLTALLTTNECSSNPCRNGGTCIDNYNGFTCRCPTAWQGPLCDVDVNECSIYAGTDLGCQNGATCHNTQGSFSCQCATNYHGIRCTERHDDCTGASHQELCGHGTCVNADRVQPGQPKYTCICDAGWTNTGSDPACTTDVNECEQGQSAPCSQNPLVQCINIPGSFRCGMCPAGYNGNGFSCVDIDECELNNGGCSVAPRVDCINTPGSRRCGPCPPGYQGNGVTCTWVGVCNVNNGGCHSQATCTDMPASVTGRVCTCRPGYVGNGEGPSGCVPQGPTTGPCASNPCMNGAVCQNSGNSYRCICNPGYTGQQCQTNINECASNPCQNQGTCTDLVNGYRCQCSSSYTGPNCEQEQQSCGGTLRGESGTLRYPSQNVNQYPHEQNCAWRIDSTPGKIIMLRFTNFSLEPSQNCRYDFLQINDGATMASNMIGKYCGNALPNGGQVINSTHHQLHLWFYSDVSVAGGGFVINWRSAPPVCGGELIGQDHGSVNSPGYPGNYPHNRTCLWTISVSPGNNIMFTFATVAIEQHQNCSYDYLEIRDGPYQTSPLLQRYCSSVSPPPLSTTGPYATVKFHSDYSLNDRGFHITYAAISAGPQCGGALTSDTGTIQSPNYPNAYNHDASCVWTITVSAADTIKLSFTAMDLEQHTNCQFDFVEVRDGPDENAQLLGRYCGSTVPSVLLSSTNTLYIMFRSDSSNTGNGFQATWTAECGGTYTASQGVIQSPYFPNAYPHNKECIYLINQPVGMRITLSFTSFDVEGPESGGNCAYDYLEIRDGSSADASSLGSYCGSQVPEDVVSSQNLMWIKFVTDGSVANTGFQAAYTAAEAPCGEILTDTTGSLQSPGHPNIYPHGANCTWLIRTTPGFVVRLTFHAFSIEENSACRYDYVEVYDNSSIVPASRLGRYCGGSVPPVLTSTNNVMTILFVSDSSLAFEGFSASYVALNASTLCGSELTDPTGVITSPNYPDNYPHERECTWTIVAPQGNQILLNFTDFSLENHPNCNYDYLEIRNGGYMSSPLVGRYCGTNIPQIMTSHSNRLWLQLKTDFSRSARGFKVIYDATASGCGADLTTPTGSFVSPNYPLPYGHNAECFWTITTSRGSQILLSFVDFNLEQGYTCNYDYVQIRDGSSSGRELAKYCGTQIPDPVTSSTNKLWVKYRTDFSVAHRGFHAFYSSICNTRLTSYRGVIESPNFPQPYPHNRNCTWIIETTLGNTINVSFSHFHIESHRDCRYDHLEIRDGDGKDSPLIRRICGMTIPQPITSSGDHLWINFKSDYSVAHNGFRLEYITNGCGGTLTSPTGSFTSPNYPNPYDHRRICEWSITVATGMAIELNISDFDLETHTSCNFDVLEIYGGPDAGAVSLARICHKQTQPQLITTTGNQMFVRFKTDGSVSFRGFRASYRSIADGCGGNFSTPTGTIASKNFPDKYPHNTDCTWLITVPPEKIIVLTFTNFDIERHTRCIFDYVAVYDGPNSNTTELMKACGNSLPVPSIYRSSGNQLYIRMRTDSSVSYTGFRAEYVTGCGGRLTAEQDGVIVSPNYPQTYGRRSNCSWLIVGEHADDRVTLTFTHMDIEQYGSCDHDSVTVYNGDDIGAPVIDSYCGKAVPAPITSSGSSMLVTFISDNSIQGTGFRAVYTKSVSSCGGDFTAERGSFTSPGYPDSYPVDIECVWTFRVSPGNKIMVSFSMFNIENQDNCNFDYVEIREGDVNGRLIGRYCGSNIPNNLTAANGIWMKFRSDAQNTGVGFIGQYSTLYGGDLTGNTGQLSSPSYPGHYPNRADYTWTITVDVGMMIRITFVTMDMESGWSTCNFDYLRFIDGGENGAEIGRYCGFNLPDPFTSTTNQLQVEFRSDWSSTGIGFLFNWQATNERPPSTTPSPGSTVPVPGCGGDLSASSTKQVVTSPGYPFGYADRLDCEWRLRTIPGFRLWINITDIDIESHGTCNYDKVTIYDNSVPSGIVLGTYCGRTGNPQPLLSTNTDVTVRFQTDVSVNRTGFSLDYKAVCGGRMIMTEGVIYSPNYPQHYPVNSNCTWQIIVPAGRTIRIKFNSTFAIAGNGVSCQGDYLQLLNGGYPDSPPLSGGREGRFCGNTAPSMTNTTSNMLHVTFVSDNINNGPNMGFRIEFSEIQVACGGHLTLTNEIASGYLMSPNYPSNYPHNVDCLWIITAPSTERIQIDFMDQFNIERHTTCNFDYIEMRDGGTVNARLLGRFCGTTLPGTIKSTGNVMFARFRTDSSVPRVGFKAMYKLAACGGRIAGQRGVVQSPNYPSNYDSNLDCEWLVEAPTGHFLTFTFDAFNVPYSSNCTVNSDYLEIRDYNASGRVLLRKCTSGNPASVLTSDSYAYIRFKTNGGTNSNGFKMRFEASVEECGGDLTTDSGTFTSPNYPGQYAHRRRCIWKIRVQQGRRITLNFDDLDIESHVRCVYDHVAVYNGIFDNSPRIKRICGDNADSTVEPVESSGNMMKVEFVTDGSVTGRGFRASYTSLNEATCGGLITSGEGLIGNISSPGYPGNYSNNLECVWIISNQNESSSSVGVRFYVFKLEYHGRCNYDFLEIREGNNERGQLIDHYCGNTTVSLPDPVYSAAPDLWIRFRTDISIVDTGFLLHYYFSDCGGILTEAEGVITSPNFPAFYNHTYNCAWHIKAPEGSQILVQFTNFSIENHPNCIFDYVDILNGEYPTSPSIGPKCGNTVPSDFTSQSNALRIIFVSDYSINAQGFRLTYRFVTGGCGGLYHSNSGHVYSPNYPRSYPHNVECVWDINVQPGYHVTLNFIPPFDLEAHDTCNFDYVEVNDAPYDNDTLVPLGRWCKNLTPPRQSSSSSRMVVKFRSDPVTNGNGFSANWSTGCGAIFTEDSGRFVSPGHPQDYSNNLLCNYTIKVNPQKFIVLEFMQSSFEIEGPSSCPYDYVAAWSGNDTTGRFLGRFCGNVAPQAVSSLGTMFIQFKTDSSLVYRGFSAMYRASECGGNFTEPYGIIRTPTHPTMYHHNANCTWLITVQEDRVIALKFTSFELEAHSTCAFDYVDILDGGELTSPRIGRFCGQVIPDMIRSTGNIMLVNFVTDYSVARTGFMASYRQTYGESQGCGGILNSTSGRFSSVDGDGDGLYENNLNCIWRIIVGDNKLVRLTIENMEIEEYGCKYDYIKVHDGLSEDDPLIGKYCGNNPPPMIKSTSNVLFVQFYTDSSVVMRGFNASYDQEDALCGGTRIASEDPQTLTSPGFPNPVSQNLRCRWTIDAPESGQQVQVTVSSLNLISNPQCQTEYLEFRDRPMGLRGRSVHFCGTGIPDTFDSVGQTVQINFAITAMSRSQGFTLKYQISNCNRTYSGYSGQIYSPGWPNNYPVNTYCEMVITGPPGTFISLYFNSFYIEAHRNCEYDFLEVRNMTYNGTTLTNRLCGNNLPDPIFTSGNAVRLTFQTDVSVTHPGFDITYTATTQGVGCGGNITGINGSLTSPGYPGNYTDRSTCTWLIRTPNRRVVTVTFTSMDLIGTVNCDRNYVKVFNGNSETSPEFGQYCGTEIPAPLRASGNTVLVKFVSDGVGSAPRFRLVFTS